MPGLVVDDHGAVGLPLSKIQACNLIELCRQAPYGKGTRTILDTDVRRVWEMDPVRFELTNPEWSTLIESILEEAKLRLGLEACTLSAHLYKLLLYEQGSFFLPHRDGARLDSMVATLIVALPSVYEGGELVVRHDGKEHEIAFPGAASGFELSYAVFYADCRHEVRPLRSGHRLCLVYNVTLEKLHKGKRLCPPSYRTISFRVAELLGSWREKGETEKLVVTLEHRYTRDGIAIDNLKGADRGRADVMFMAAEQAGCFAHLALTTLWQHGDVDHDHRDYFNPGRWSYRSRSRTRGDGGSGREHEMGEIFDVRLTANHWSDRHGNTRNFGEIPVEGDELVTSRALDDGDPSEEEFEDYTGNAGLTLERWYHRAAIVIWPKDRHFSVLCGAGTRAAVGGLEAMVMTSERSPGEQGEATRRDRLQFAGAIIDGWETPDPWSFYGDDEFDQGVFSMLLCKLDDPGLMRRFLSEIVRADGNVEIHQEFTEFCRRHGLGCLEDELIRTIDGASEATLLRNARLLHLLCTNPDLGEGDAEVCIRLCRSAADALKRFDDQPPRNAWERREIDRSALLVTLAEAMLEIGAQRPLRQVIDHALASQGTYDLTDTHLEAIFRLELRLKALSPTENAMAFWLSACRRELQARTAQEPQAPEDFRRNAELSCKCADCRELSRFLADPVEHECRMPLNTERRKHLHRIIDGDQCDVTHVTERRGSPYTLVCKKTTASYERACREFERDKRNLSWLAQVEKGLGKSPTDRSNRRVGAK